EIMPHQRDFDLFARGNFVRMDPPKHRKLRSLVSQAFTPRMVTGLAPRIAELTAELLDELRGAERFDLVDRLAYPLPVIVIAELLGIPVEDRGIFRQWAETLFSSNQQTSEVRLDEAALKALFAAVAPTMREMNGYLLAHIQQRRARRADDLTSALVTAEVDGERLDDQEIVGFVGLLLLAGHVTTTALLGNAVLTLDEHPGTADQLRADPTRIPGAIEEVLRYRSPFPPTRPTRHERRAARRAHDRRRRDRRRVDRFGESRPRAVPRARPFRRPSHAQPASRVRARSTLLPRRSSGQARSQDRARHP